MAFKLTNSFITFYVIINVVINKYLSIFILIYLNNILIYTKNTLEDYKRKVN